MTLHSSLGETGYVLPKDTDVPRASGYWHYWVAARSMTSLEDRVQSQGEEQLLLNCQVGIIIVSNHRYWLYTMEEIKRETIYMMPGTEQCSVCPFFLFFSTFFLMLTVNLLFWSKLVWGPGLQSWVCCTLLLSSFFHIWVAGLSLVLLLWPAKTVAVHIFVFKSVTWEYHPGSTQEMWNREGFAGDHVWGSWCPLRSWGPSMSLQRASEA